MAEVGAPEGFDDVVAAHQPDPRRRARRPRRTGASPSQSTTPTPRRRAAELGGKVIVPPFDAPWVRMTVISDPQGATFIASKFVPENKDLGG